MEPVAASLKERFVAVFAAVAITAYLAAGWTAPLIATLLLSLLFLRDLAKRLFARQLSSDLLAGVSIIASAVMGQYLVGAIIVLMLSGGAAIERYATSRASNVLTALARRMPSIAHRRERLRVADADVSAVGIGDRLVVYPHEICPADGTVLEGHGIMDESYLTGEPFLISKAPGSAVLSGAINGDTPLEIEVARLPRDSRYAQIMRVMEESEQRKPRLRRLADQLGAWYTPLALAIAIGGWAASGDATRFLAVVVIATPCPLLIAIPVAVVGAISLYARHGIVIKNPAALEQIGQCRTWIFDKTGTLTYGRPSLTEIAPGPGFESKQALWLAASLEQYSKHPLAAAILRSAREQNLGPAPVSRLSEKPGEGLRGMVNGDEVVITGRGKLDSGLVPAQMAGLECIVLVNGRFAALMRFRDEPREESRPFIAHLHPRHKATRILLLSGDRVSEAEYLARAVGIGQVHASKTPEEKVAVVSGEAARVPTLFVGDGINDAPAMRTATVAVALGARSDITAEAGDAVILEPTLKKVDELVHIGQRMRRIALESAIGGMMLSLAGTLLAAGGWLPPVGGAIGQEVIDLLAVLNALRVAFPRGELSDF
ncbi:MAG: cadmium-translocating P-type ATPase [Acidobacteria bacterium]|nr:cadmium-translocating P-type ATPase [Acidobacteriota bacterium]